MTPTTIYVRDLLVSGNALVVPREVDLTDLGPDGRLYRLYRFGYEPTSRGLSPEQFEHLQAAWIGFELTLPREPSIAAALTRGPR